MCLTDRYVEEPTHYITRTIKSTASPQHIEACKHLYSMVFDNPIRHITDNNKTHYPTFWGFNSWEEFETRYNRIPLKECRRYFELCKSKIRKLTFDFDDGSKSPKTKLNIPVDVFNETIKRWGEIINDFLINVCGYTGDLTYKCLYVKEGDIINSVHIIYNEVWVHYLDNKDIVKTLNAENETENSVLSGFLADTAVYGSTQNFRLLHNTKANQYRPLICDMEEEEHKDDIKYNYNIKDTLIGSYNDEVANIHYTAPPIIDTSLICGEATIINNPPKDPKPLTDPIIEASITPERETNKPIRYYTDIEDVLSDAIRDLNDRIFTREHAHKWITLTNIFKKYQLYSMVDWGQLSINRSGGDYEENARFIKMIDIKKTTSGFPSLLIILNEYLDNYTLEQRREWDYKDICECVEEMNNLDGGTISTNKHILKQLEEGLTKVVKKDMLITDINGDLVFCFSPSMGTLISGGETINYFYQYQLRNSLGSNSDLYYKQHHKEIIRIDDIAGKETEDIIDAYITNTTDPNNRLMAINAYCGSGKTYHIVQRIIKYISTHNTKPFMLISPNNSLNKEMVGNIEGYEVSIKSHLDKTIQAGDNIITSLESLKKTLTRVGDFFSIVILDEIESILSHFEADTTNLKGNDKARVFTLFCQVLRKADKVIILDANVSKYRLELIANIMKVEEPPLYIFNTNNYLNYNHNIYVNEPLFRHNLSIDILNNKKVVICSDSRRFTDSHFNSLVWELKRMKGKARNILLVNGTRLVITTIEEGKRTDILNSKEEKDRSEFYENIEQTLSDNKIDFFIYSPSITAGISVNKYTFDVLYCDFTNMVMCVRLMFQMFYRIRNLTEKSINIHFKYLPKPLCKATDLITYKKHCELPNKIMVENNTFELDDDEQYNPVEDDLFYTMRSNNKLELFESKKNAYQILYILMTYNNGVSLNFNTTHYKLDEDHPYYDFGEELKAKEYHDYKTTDIHYTDEATGEIYLDIKKYVNTKIEIDRNKEIRDRGDEVDDGEIDYIFYGKFSNLIDFTIMGVEEDGRDKVDYKASGLFRLGDIIDYSYSNGVDGVDKPFKCDRIDHVDVITIKIMEKWVNYINSMDFYNGFMKDHVRKDIRALKRQLNPNNDNKNTYVATAEDEKKMKYDKMNDYIAGNNKTHAYKEFNKALNKPPHHITDDVYLSRLMGLNPLKEHSQYINYPHEQGLTIIERPITDGENEVILSNSVMYALFKQPDIIKISNDIMGLDIIGFKPKPYTKKSDMFKILFKVMAYGGRCVKYINGHTTKPEDNFKIGLNKGFYYRDYQHIRIGDRFITDYEYMEFTNIIKNISVQTSIPAYLFNRYTEDEVLKVRKGVYIKQSQPLLKVETKASKNIKRSIQYIHTGDTIDKIPLYKQTITRYNAEPYHIYTPYTPNPAVITITTTQPHKALQEDINDDIIAYIKNKGVPLTL